MLTCPNCHAQVEDDSRFCESCGAPIQAPAPSAETTFCPNCGSKVEAGNPFCPNCGSPMNGDTPPTPSEQKKSGKADKKKKEKEKEKEKPKSKKGILIAVLGVVVVAALAGAFVFFLGNTGGSGKNYAMYIKDKEIYYTGFSRNDPWQVTSRFIDSDGLDSYDLASGAYALGNMCQFSEDGSLLFFPDKISYYDDGFTLYYRNINKPDREASKIDSDVISYSVSDDASAITYLKNGTLYQYDRKKEDKQKLASDIQEYRVSDDGRTILYMNTDYELYSAVKGGDREKIDSDLTALSFVSEDLSTVFYIKEGTLYKKEVGGEKEKISSDVEDVIKAYDSGEVYYIKADTAEVPLMDFVYDDKKEADASLTEPQSPIWGDPDYDAKYEAYEQAYEEYRAKQNRDYLREILNEETIEQTNYTLCYYAGEENTTISDTFTNSSYACAADKPVITYTAYDPSDDIGVKLSEAESIHDISSQAVEALYSAGERYVAVGSVSASLDQDEATGFRLSPDGTELYYLDEVPEEKNYGELYRVSVSSSAELSSPELYDSDVCTENLRFINTDKFLYFKDYKDGKGEMYINQEKIDYDVNSYSIHYDKDADRMIYFTDWNSDKGYGTLKIYAKKEAEKIADDVHSSSLMPNGNVLYLSDYSQKYYHGDLYLWNKKDAEKIDDSVTCILSVY